MATHKNHGKGGSGKMPMKPGMGKKMGSGMPMKEHMMPEQHKKMMGGKKK